MPVDNHPVHPLTQRPKGHRAGCYNRPDFKPFFYATEKRIDEHGGVTWVPKKILHVTSNKCVTAGSLPECSGCKHSK